MRRVARELGENLNEEELQVGGVAHVRVSSVSTLM
jgi:hypothetical protein